MKTLNQKLKLGFIWSLMVLLISTAAFGADQLTPPVAPTVGDGNDGTVTVRPTGKIPAGEIPRLGDGKKKAFNPYTDKNPVTGKYFFQEGLFKKAPLPKLLSDALVKAGAAGINNLEDLDDSPEANAIKATALSKAHYAQLEIELNRFWGWVSNDIFILRLIDNWVFMQRGVIFAVRPLIRFYATNNSIPATGYKENEGLFAARNTDFNAGETVWGFAGILGAEDYYKTGIKNMRKYEKALANPEDNARVYYNFRKDDALGLIEAMLSQELIGTMAGDLVQKDEEVSWIKADNRIYKTIGMAHVIRDVLVTAVFMHPEYFSLNQSYRLHLSETFKALNEILVFGPAVVLQAKADSVFANHRKSMSGYIVRIQQNLNAIKNLLIH